MSIKLSASEKKALNLLKKIDELAKSEDFNATVFGQSGYFLAFLKNPTKEQVNLESKKECILNDRVIWKSQNLIGDGGDSDFV